MEKVKEFLILFLFFLIVLVLFEIKEELIQLSFKAHNICVISNEDLFFLREKKINIKELAKRIKKECQILLSKDGKVIWGGKSIKEILGANSF